MSGSSIRLNLKYPPESPEKEGIQVKYNFYFPYETEGTI